MAYFTHMSTLVGGSFTHMSGITDLEIMEVKGEVRLYSASFADGGLQSIVLADGQVANYCDDIGYGSTRGTAGVTDIAVGVHKGREFLIPAGKYDDEVATHRLTEQGEFEEVITVSGNISEIGGFTTAEVVMFGNEAVVFASQRGQSGFQQFKVRNTLDLYYTGKTEDTEDTHIGDISAMTSMKIGARTFLFAASSMDAGVTSYEITKNAKAYYKDNVDPQDGAGFSFASVLDTASVGRNNFLLMGAAGTDSISVFRVRDKGQMDEMDFMQDTMDTRFGGINAMEVFQVGERVFVLAGGEDDGITLFELDGTGQLFVLASLADQLDTTLTNIESIAAHVFENQIQVFVAGSGEAGITQFSIDLGGLIQGGRNADIIQGSNDDDLIFGFRGRDTINGGNGNDRIVDGSSTDVLTGGAGADVFVFVQDGRTDDITDFVMGVDKIDLSDFFMLYHYTSLTIKEKPYGFIIYANDEAVRVMVPDSQSATTDDFGQDDFIF